jgi:Caspase domain/Tetratricopeptide repeat
VAGRLALIVGSQCDGLQPLPFVDELAARLHAALGAGQWRAASGGDWVRNPTTAELRATVEEAFTTANDAAATLFVAFIGHGVASGDEDFYLMTRDAPADKPKSHNAFHFTQFIRDELKDYTGLDGLVFLVDACQAGEGVRGAATRWADVLAANKGRLELLVASGKGSAYDGCFTRAILDTFETGLVARGDALLCADLLPEVSRCKGQQQYLAYNGATLISGDPGLWLVPNKARSRDAVTGHPSAGLVDQLTAGVILTDSVRENLIAIEESGAARLRLAVGAAGSGKSTLLALFIRPKVAKILDIADDYIKAAAFLDATSTLESLAAELSAQLAVTVPQYPQAREAVDASMTGQDLASHGSWDTLVRLPLARCTESGRIHIIVDGLDQPEQGAREPILAAVEFITSTAPAAELGHVRLIAGVRSGVNIDTRTELAHAHRIDVSAPGAGELAKAATNAAVANVSESLLTEGIDRDMSGGWLIARLIGEIAASTGEPAPITDLPALVAARIAVSCACTDEAGEALHTLNAIAAAGYGPVLPIGLLAAAVADTDAQPPLSRIRDTVVTFGTLISRGNPGTEHETLGISHHALVGPVAEYMCDRGVDPAAAHHAIIGAWQRLSDSDRGRADDEAASYWVAAAPRHYLAVGDSSEALKALQSAETLNAIDNRDRWAAWLPLFEQAQGPVHPDTVDAEAQHAHWTGKSGDPRTARRIFARQVRALEQEREDNDLQLITAREKLADWTGQAGQPDRARRMLEQLMPHRRAVSGDRDLATLQAAMDLAFWTGESGDLDAAFVLYDGLLPELDETLGPRDRNTLGARSHYARFLGEAGRPRDAKEIVIAVLADTERALGADHDDTLWVRNNLAWQTGEVDGAEAAREMYAVLVQDRERLSNPENHGTLVARRDLAIWTGRAGKAASARDQLQELLPIRIRNYGPDTTDALYERDCLAEWTGKAGDPQAAVDQYAELLEIHKTKFGANSDKTNDIRRKLDEWRAAAADNS